MSYKYILTLKEQFVPRVNILPIPPLRPGGEARLSFINMVTQLGILLPLNLSICDDL